MLLRPSLLPLAFRLVLLAVLGCASSRRAADEIADEDASSSAVSSVGASTGSMTMLTAAASAAGSDEAAGAAGSSAGSAAGSGAAAPAAMNPECPLGDDNFNFGTNDSEFGAAYGHAKAACDQTLRWQCGEMMVTLDAAGCVVGFGKSPTTGGDLATGYADCMVEELAGSCSRCEHETTRRFYESCTIL